MTAQPIAQEDPHDPQAILAQLTRLPDHERETFLQQYREAAQAAADDPGNYPRLAACLRMWSVKARVLPQVLAERPNYYEELAAAHQAVRDGTAKTVPIEDALAQVMGISREEAEQYWGGKVAEARAARAQGA